MHTFSKNNIATLLLVLCTFYVNAQSTLEGLVKDKSSGESLPGASVILSGTSLGTATNFEGYFSLKNIPAGKQSIQVSFIGYKPQTFEIDFKAGATVKQNLLLIPDGFELDDVVVSAQARGQMDAINRQLSAIEIKNVVSADKIQEIPDANAAESIGRLPGVSVNRSGGEGNKVVIRGLSPKYNKIQIDGVELAATGSDDRSVDISMISPYSLDGIEVVKAITADMDAEAVGGSVNLKMKKAKKGTHGSFSVQGGYNGLNSQLGDFLASGMLSKRFYDNKFGVLFQANYEQRNRSSLQEDHGWGLRDNDIEDNDMELQLNSDAKKNKNTLKKRAGATLVLDYKWVTGSLVFSNFGSIVHTENESFNRTAKRNQHLNYGGGTSFTDLAIYTNTMKLKQRISVFDMDFTVSHSYSGRQSPENYGWGGYTPSTTSELYDEFDYLEPNQLWETVETASEANLYMSNFSFNKSENKEHKWAQNANLTYDFFINKKLSGKIKVGEKIRYSDRVYDVTSSSIPLKINQSNWIEALNIAMPEFNPEGEENMSYTWYMDETDLQQDFPEPNIDQLKEVARVLLPGDGYYADSLHSTGIHVTNSRKNDYYGTELLLAGYIMAEINIGKKIKIIPGLRYENNTTAYNGFRSEVLTLQNVEIHGYDTTIKVNHDIWLPNFHLRYKPVKWFDVRFAYTNTLARPSYSQIVPKWGITPGTSIGYYNNPYLKPELSENFDLYLSFHGNKLGLFTVGGFTKHITDKISNEYKRQLRDSANARPGFMEHPNDFKLPYDATVYAYINPKLNSKYDGYVRGIEIEWQSNLYWLPGLWKNLVLNANYTTAFSKTQYALNLKDEEILDTVGYRIPETQQFPITQTRITYKDTAYTDAMVNQPKHIINLTIGYDYKGFSIRTSMLYQHEIFKGSANFEPNKKYKRAYLRWDLNVKQNLDFWVKGLQVYANWNNLTSETDDIFKNGTIKNRLTSKDIYSYTIDLGLRYKF